MGLSPGLELARGTHCHKKEETLRPGCAQSYRQGSPLDLGSLHPSGRLPLFSLGWAGGSECWHIVTRWVDSASPGAGPGEAAAWL